MTQTKVEIHCLLAFTNTQSRNIILPVRIRHCFQALFDLFSECLNEVWKGDMGVKGFKEEGEGENGRQTHDAGEL